MCEHVPYMLLHRSDSATRSCASIFFSFKGIYVLFFFNDSFSGSRAEMLLSGCRQTLFGGVVNLH